MFLRFDLRDMGRRTPSTNPAAAEMKIKTAWGIATVADSRCVSTGSVFWTTRIATKMARTDAAINFRLRIELRSYADMYLDSPMLKATSGKQKIKQPGTPGDLDGSLLPWLEKRDVAQYGSRWEAPSLK